jgi:polygalacturonase
VNSYLADLFDNKGRSVLPEGESASRLGRGRATPGVPLPLRHTFVLLLGFLGLTAATLSAQDSRPLTEPVFPATCVVLHAPLRSNADGPAIGPTVAEQDAESKAETAMVTQSWQGCGAKHQAVELALGADSSYSAFLLNPLELPPGVSLIIDGGVTVFASRDPQNYQDLTTLPDVVCGDFGPGTTYKVDLGCRAFLTLNADSGVYGYGVIDGQGDKVLLGGPHANVLTWWKLTTDKNTCDPTSKNPDCEQASPELISGGNIPGPNSPTNNNNLILYKITIRNPPFHTVKLGGTNVTVWGVKVQAPWNIPNTDGFDIHASNVTVYDTTVANGDQEIAFGSSDGPSTNITVDHFNGYSKGGITILGSGFATSNLLVQNVNITGDLPSVVNHSVNGMTESEMAQKYGLMSYGQALPNATNDLKALQMSDSSQKNPTKSGSQISAATFQSICIQDIVKPIELAFTSADNYPTVKDVVFKDIHVLAPTSQFPEMNKGIPTTNPGSYEISFVTGPPQYINQFTLDNVVFDERPTGGTPPLASIDAEGNEITTATNVYPPILNLLKQAYSSSGPVTLHGPTTRILNDNKYAATTSVSSASLAYACPAGPMPFTIGDLYVSLGSDLATGASTNLQSASVMAGGSVTLNAVVQPIMSQTTNYIKGSYGATPGLLAVGSPALTNPVTFYEGTMAVGVGTLSANGTLASTVVKNISAGTHTYTAVYSADTFYANLNFGSVTVQATPAPVAIAGPKNATVTSRELTLDGTASTSGDGKPLTYMWSIPPGGQPAAILYADTALPTIQFSVPRGIYTFQLTVTDSTGTSASDLVMVNYQGTR